MLPDLKALPGLLRLLPAFKALLALPHWEAQVLCSISPLLVSLLLGQTF